MIVDYLDLKSISNFYTAMKMNARRTYTIVCRKCGRKFISRLGAYRNFRCKMLWTNDYKCKSCIHDFIHKFIGEFAEMHMRGGSIVSRYTINRQSKARLRTIHLCS